MIGSLKKSQMILEFDNLVFDKQIHSESCISDGLEMPKLRKLCTSACKNLPMIDYSGGGTTDANMPRDDVSEVAVKSKASKPLKAWQKSYSSYGRAVDALMEWRTTIPEELRPALWLISQIPGDGGGRFMITFDGPMTPSFPIPEEGLRQAEKIGEVNSVSYINNCVSEFEEGLREEGFHA